jgi:hypothetical protein
MDYRDGEAGPADEARRRRKKDAGEKKACRFAAAPTTTL